MKLRLLDSAAYEAVAAALAPTWRQDHEQENYFFDGTQGELNSQRAVLRCRFYGVDKKAVLTLKVSVAAPVGTRPDTQPR